MFLLKNFLLFSLSLLLFGEPITRYQIATIAFYNVENLFDTLNSVDQIDGFRHYENLGYHVAIPYDKAPKSLIKKPSEFSLHNIRDQIHFLDTQDEEYTNRSPRYYNTKRYLEKLDHITDILKEFGPLNEPPEVVGLCEIENEHVLTDLITHPNLKPFNYDFIHFNSFDYRGIDVALLYKQDRFIPLTAKRYGTYLKKKKKTYRLRTRDQLWVNGLLDGESINFIINHWPSRRGGVLKSEPLRKQAAQTTLKIIEHIQINDSLAKIIIMGDFNDNPNNKSIQLIENQNFTNPLSNIFKKGLGTLVWNDVWNLFDQFILSNNFSKKIVVPNTYFFVKSGIYNSQKLKISKGRFKGYPYRTYNGKKYNGGYSDHFPIYLILGRKMNIKN